MSCSDCERLKTLLGQRELDLKRAYEGVSIMMECITTALKQLDDVARTLAKATLAKAMK